MNKFWLQYCVQNFGCFRAPSRIILQSADMKKEKKAAKATAANKIRIIRSVLRAASSSFNDPSISFFFRLLLCLPWRARGNFWFLAKKEVQRFGLLRFIPLFSLFSSNYAKTPILSVAVAKWGKIRWLGH